MKFSWGPMEPVGPPRCPHGAIQRVADHPGLVRGGWWGLVAHVVSHGEGVSTAYGVQTKRSCLGAVVGGGGGAVVVNTVTLRKFMPDSLHFW